MAIAVVFFLVAIVAAAEHQNDIDKLLKFTDLKIEVLNKVRQDLVRHEARKPRDAKMYDVNMEEFLRKRVKKRADQVFSRLDFKNALPKYSDALKNRVFEGVTIEVSQNASAFIKPLVRTTLLYRVNSACKAFITIAQYGKNILLACSGHSVQILDLNGQVKAETTVNFKPDFIQSLGQSGTFSNKSRME